MKRRVLLAGLVLGLVSCSGSDDPSDSASCLDVENPALLEAIGASSAKAVRAGTDGAFVATTGGATWFTTAELDGDDSGLVLPLNDEAREASDVGVDVPEGAPAFKGHTDDDPGARVARSCV